MSPIRLRTGSVDDTRAVGACLGAVVRAGDVVALTGELGAGKTALVQGAAAALGVTERVTSPSFILRKDYRGRVDVVHLDVYRLQTLQEVVELDWDEALDGRSVVFVEWGDAMRPLLPDEHLEIELRVDSDSTGSGPATGDTAAEAGAEPRRITLRPHGDDWSRRLMELSGRLAQWREQD